ncbi:hypothetical protein A2765_06615 [Candidatus Kaiserbacteria bacterium RIFCSPHIGHO2_01_FULL_56_24]|uniref:CARDB domain-containing protein n=1 Tax=Candidatus Kaiserbacteria bacterium RIFCSPHIGHO2_01_FULL_56_24 TaxID=1798487 RepID=A0A1F6DBI7_9BACT|nr:MAG: hypothetical protein A2765_06615 [Candidatus Kaiserbacteria bacterium RIFCSPHIGHO2_01_FULL_56_24]
MADPQKQDAPEHEPERQESRSMAMLSNALAIIGFIILIIIVVWGLIHIASLSSISWGSIFSSKPRVEIVAPKNATSGESVALTWKYTGKEAGTFSFLYKCAQNVHLLTSKSGTSNVMTRIPCGTAINVGSSTAATVVPVNNTEASVPVSMTIMFASQDGKTRAEGVAIVDVAPKAGATPPVETPEQPATKPTTSKPSYSAKPAVALVPHAASGPADLRVAMITVGVMHPSGALINRMPTSPYDIIGVEFDIANVGGSATGSWYFSGQLPTGGSVYPYHSPTQISLAPGEHIVSVLRFSPNMRPGTVTITADPSNIVREANETNNTVSQNI